MPLTLHSKVEIARVIVLARASALHRGKRDPSPLDNGCGTVSVGLHETGSAGVLRDVSIVFYNRTAVM
jgi:hypothetical protein